MKPQTYPRPRAILFDLDGTLADTARDLGTALNHLLIEEHRATVAYDSIWPVASHGARGLIQLGFGIDRAHADFERLRLRFLDLYEAHFCDETVLFPGVSALLTQLTQQGLQWGIVTNKPMRFTDRLLPTLGFPSLPGVVVSGDTVGVPKPDPKPMLHAASQLNLPPAACWYVGDAERDIVAGRVVGMPTILAKYGYIAETDQPATWGADMEITSPAGLLDYLQG